MVLYDINKDEAREIAKKNLLEYRSDDLVALGKRKAPATAEDTTTESETPEKRRKVDKYRGKDPIQSVTSIEVVKEIVGRKP